MRPSGDAMFGERRTRCNPDPVQSAHPEIRASGKSASGPIRASRAVRAAVSPVLECRLEDAMHGIEIVDIAHAIQLAVAPVFLLSGVGVLLGVLTNRLARIVDRARAAEARLDDAQTEHERGDLADKLAVLAQRARHINVAITLITITALLVSLVVALLFASTFVPINLAVYVAVLFVASMLTLVIALLSFLLEVRISIASLRIGTLPKKSPEFVARGE
jgi:hypothetical protein